LEEPFVDMPGRSAAAERVMSERFDVCIVGLGPAGAATAARLADLGIGAIVLERLPAKKPWGGESFTGAIRGPLTALGMWKRFLSAEPVAGYEQRCAWGEAGTADSIFNVHGNAWHVDRDRFNVDLRAAVEERSIPLLCYESLDRLKRDGDGWHITLDARRTVSARYLVDATGRAGAVGRRLGVRPRIHDRLVALTALVPRNSAFDHAMVISTAHDGWWYAAPVPRGHVLAYFTDSDLAPRHLPRSMQIVPANSAFTETPSRDGWLVVGDACAAHDPLCGWGVHRALANGIRAADAIGFYLESGDASRLDAYDRHCRDQFDAYRIGLAQHYSYERRFAASPFWQRRLDDSRVSAVLRDPTH
jgi:flavin-dependent dehydrogenase